MRVSSMLALLLSFIALLVLGYTNAMAYDMPLVSEEEASDFAVFSVLSSATGGIPDNKIQVQSINWLSDVWVCEVEDISNQHTYSLVFDDNGLIHRFHDTHCILPTRIEPVPDEPIEEDEAGFLENSHQLTISWLTLTRGWTFESFFLLQKVNDEMMVFSINGLSEYVAVTREKDGSFRICSYGHMMSSQGAYGDGITQQDAISIAKKRLSMDNPKIAFVGFSVPAAFEHNVTIIDNILCEVDSAYIPSWIIFARTGWAEDMSIAMHYMRINAVTGEVLVDAWICNGSEP